VSRDMARYDKKQSDCFRTISRDVAWRRARGFILLLQIPLK
jgi:hypothetical protein